jgi:predicted O-methyltransferase YrrM
MTGKKWLFSICLLLFQVMAFSFKAPEPASIITQDNLDKKVKAFLDSHRYGWRDMNVPRSDGQLLYDIIIKNGYTKALEIGTSTGHSAVWIAWALSKTGGKLITIEIDEQRHKEALANFEEAGVAAYIDARLADAHELVKELKGPFDFVFSDADKGWYKNYFTDVFPKLEVGGCFTTHNISGRGRGRRRGGGSGDYYDYIMSLPSMETTLDSNGGGVLVSYKKSEK